MALEMGVGEKDFLVIRNKNAKVLLMRYACKGLDIVPDMQKTLNKCLPTSIYYLHSY